MVVSCQPRAVEVIVEGQAFLLSELDSFFVPPYNRYMVRNHSKSREAVLFFHVSKNAAALK